MVDSLVDEWAPAFAFRGMAMRATGSPDAQAPLAQMIGPGARVSESAAAMDIRSQVHELKSISMTIPAFAIWQISTLEQCFQRYCNILQVVSRDVRFRRHCVALMASAERIFDGLNLVRSSNQWTTFNRTAFELRQDCDLLAGLLGG